MNRLTRAHALAFMVLCLLVAAGLRLPLLPTAPPGLHYDEAANGILAADIGIGGERPVFISSYTGKEVLFFYLAGGMMRLVGESIFSLRLTAAFVGLLTVAATYWLGREMLADRRLAILACSLLAVSFWHVLFSRLGFRAITQPLLQVLTVAALFRGLRRNQRRWIVTAGVFLGLTAYTYLAARIFPILLLIALLPFLLNRAAWRRRWLQIALFSASALLVLLPLLIYFWGHPDAFWVRIGQVAPETGSASLTLWQSLLKSWGMFFLQGDSFWRFNLPGRPLFNWLWGGLLVVGWAVSLLRWRRYTYDWQRSAITLLIFTPLVMILPTALATNELVPSNLRAIGLIPFIFYLPAIGLVFLSYDVEKRTGFPPLTATIILISIAVLLSGGLSTAQAYFDRWAGESKLYYEADGDLTAVARFLDETEIEGKSVYVAAPHYRHPTVAFLSRNYEAVKWLPESQALVFPPVGPALVIYPHNSPVPEWARPYLGAGQQVDVSQQEMPSGAFVAFELPAGSFPAPIPNQAGANFGDTITLLGYDLAPLQEGDDLEITLFWRIEQSPQGDYSPFFQLEDAWGRRWSQEETFAYPAKQWAPGETIIQGVDLALPPGLPRGEYRLRIGLFDPATGRQLPRLDEEGRYAGDAYFVENIALQSAALPVELPDPPIAVGDQVVPGLQLLGYGRGGPTAVAGAPAGLSFWWLATELLPELTMRLDLVDVDGEVHALAETAPVQGTFPFTEWGSPQFVIDHQVMNIPPDFAAGDYQYQLRVVDAGGDVLYTQDLGSVKIETTNRLFAPPDFSEEVGAVFGSEIRLLGYDLTPAAENKALLKLIWQAEQAPSADYTVFVHLLNQDGSCCLWQQDVMPDQGRYPTSRWLPGEVVVDQYEIIMGADAPPGTYPLEVGLYFGETGQRLSIEGLDQELRDALMLRPVSIP